MFSVRQEKLLAFLVRVFVHTQPTAIWSCLDEGRSEFLRKHTVVWASSSMGIQTLAVLFIKMAEERLFATDFNVKGGGQDGTSTIILLTVKVVESTSVKPKGIWKEWHGAMEWWSSKPKTQELMKFTMPLKVEGSTFRFDLMIRFLIGVIVFGATVSPVPVNVTKRTSAATTDCCRMISDRKFAILRKCSLINLTKSKHGLIMDQYDHSFEKLWRRTKRSRRKERSRQCRIMLAEYSGKKKVRNVYHLLRYVVKRQVIWDTYMMHRIALDCHSSFRFVHLQNKKIHESMT